MCHYSDCNVNGFRFYTKGREMHRSQNSSTLVIGEHDAMGVDFMV